MIIDFHTHVFPDRIAANAIERLEKAINAKASTDGTLTGLLSSMEKNGVDMSIILPVATKAAQFVNIASFASSINQQYSDKVLSFGGIHPDCVNYRKELNIIADLGCKGVKIHPDHQKVMIDDIRFMRIIDYATELGLVVITHAGIDVSMQNSAYCPPKRMRKVLDEVKPEKMVLAHLGGWGMWDEVYDCIAGEKVFLDTAFIYHAITKEQFLEIMEKHGSDKILFGSDCPWSDMGKAVDWIKSLSLPKNVEEDIFSGNAKRLLRMD